MEKPPKYGQYRCEDYYASQWSGQGYWDEFAQVYLIVPAEEVEEIPGQAFLAVGRPGVDGIAFGYRRGQAGVWAFYPMEETFVLLAATIEEFVKKWQDDLIRL